MKAQVAEEVHPTQNNSVGRYAVDALLRAKGFRIHSRPRKGPVLWERDGEVMEECAALGLLPKRDLADARWSEQNYWFSRARTDDKTTRR